MKQWKKAFPHLGGSVLAHEHDLGNYWWGKVKNRTSKLYYVIELFGSVLCLPLVFFSLDGTVFHFYLQIAGLCVILFCLGEDSQVLSAAWSQQTTRYRTPSLETSQREKWGLTETIFGLCLTLVIPAEDLQTIVSAGVLVYNEIVCLHFKPAYVFIPSFSFSVDWKSKKDDLLFNVVEVTQPTF